MRKINVCVTGACGKIAYSMYNSLCTGYVFGEGTCLDLRLLDLQSKATELKILREELDDCCYQNVETISIFSDDVDHMAFEDADVVIFLGGMARKPGMERNEVFEINAEIFAKQGKMLEKYAKKTCKSLVIANPTNTNCLVLAANAPSIPKSNFTALTRLDYNRFIGQTAKLFNCRVNQIHNVILWGNHSRKQYCDITKLEIEGLSAEFIANKIKELNFQSIEKVMYERGGFILEKAGGNAYISSTKAIIDHLRDLFRGCDRTVSMGIVVDTPIYGLPTGLCFSMPVTCLGNGNYTIIADLSPNEYQRKRIEESREELLKEKSIVEQFLPPCQE